MTSKITRESFEAEVRKMFEDSPAKAAPDFSLDQFGEYCGEVGSYYAAGWYGHLELLWKVYKLAYSAGAASMKERAAKRLENGSFLHDQAPAKLLSIEAAAAIRALSGLEE